MKDKIIEKAQALCLKFITAIEGSGYSKNSGTYADCKELLDMIGDYKSQDLNVDKLSGGFDETGN